MGFRLPAYIFIVLTLSALGAGLYGFWDGMDEDKQAQIYERFHNDTVNVTQEVGQLGISYMAITPAWQIEWLGDENKKTWMLEDWPFIDQADFVFFFIWWIIAGVISRFIIHLPKEKISWVVKILIVVALFTIGTVLVYVLVKTIFYLQYLSAAQDLGATTQEALAVRQAEIEQINQAGAAIPMLTTSLIGGFLMVTSLFRWRRRP